MPWTMNPWWSAFRKVYLLDPKRADKVLSRVFVVKFTSGDELTASSWMSLVVLRHVWVHESGCGDDNDWRPSAPCGDSGGLELDTRDANGHQPQKSCFSVFFLNMVLPNYHSQSASMDSSPRPPLQRRHDLAVVKQQLVVVVSVASTLFVLCPEWLQFYRNLAVIPLLAWLTAKGFDLVIMLNDKWDNAPAMVKYFVPIDFPQITPPFEKMRSLGNRQLAVARTKFRHLSSEVRAVVLMVVNWVLAQISGGESVWALKQSPSLTYASRSNWNRVYSFRGEESEVCAKTRWMVGDSRHNAAHQRRCRHRFRYKHHCRDRWSHYLGPYTDNISSGHSSTVHFPGSNVTLSGA